MSQVSDFIDSYLMLCNQGSIDQLMNLFTVDATIEDPIATRFSGDTVRSFYQSAAAMGVKFSRTGATRMASHYIAFPLRVQYPSGASIDAIEIVALGQGGRIQSVHAYWGPTDDNKVITIERYIDSLNNRDSNNLSDFFDPSIGIEDPIGSPPRFGFEGTKQFYGLAATINLQAELGGVICCAGNFAAFPLTVLMDNRGQRMRFEGLDLFEYNDAGRIISGKVFWSGENMTVVG
ncbi:nuclear transport factor 2 family protein [Oceanicoccus sp. KOV_DT_Chl]|uniref:nuclear transport factor 2 family protein n=1 Tax=Oceanicoccus sp. KOV_DT_Chl TaxID=1904639 RepID=UPI000C7BD5B2|nr:nuclear transport factor 2 family protein [Oceanicoccus sp. KOV_DT_Chl]